MVYEAVICKYCGQQEPVKRHGKSPSGQKRYRCYGCGKTFLAHYSNRASDPSVKEQIIQMALNGNGVRDTARLLKISASTVCLHLKKSNQVSYVNPAYWQKQLIVSLKVDEMWSFVGTKTHPRWLWWAEDALNGQIVAFVFGRRPHATFRGLLALLQQAGIGVKQCITDRWWGAARAGLL